MSKVTLPPEKKRLAYSRDHYKGGGEHNKGWRKAKPLKKAKARRAFRKASNDLLRVCAVDPEAAPEGAIRKQGSVEQRRVVDWGPMTLREFVATRRIRNQLNVGAKRARRALLPEVNPTFVQTSVDGDAGSEGGALPCR